MEDVLDPHDFRASDSSSDVDDSFLNDTHLKPHYDADASTYIKPRRSPLQWLVWYGEVFVPHVIIWIRRYKPVFLLNDLLAGLVVSAMLIPQGMAYSLLAGQPPINGLYSCLLAPAAYFLLGSSMVVSVGPVALTAILTNQGVSSLMPADENEFVAYSMVLTLMTGVFLFLLGVLRMGFLTRYLSNTVLRGFITAAGTIIVVSQMESFLGLRVPPGVLSRFFLVQVVQQLGYLPTMNPWTLLTAGMSTMLLVFFKWKRIPRWIPGPLIVVVLGTLISWAVDMESLGVAVVGFIPSGFPTLSVPAVDGNLVTSLIPTCIEVALVAYIGQIALGTMFAQQDGYTIRPTKEFLALGVANVATSFLPCQPVNASFSRTAVNHDMNAKSPFAGLVVVGILVVVLSFLTEVLYFLPKAVLASVVCMSVKSLIAVEELKFLWKVDRVEFLLFLGVFLATVGVGIEWGIIISVLLSLVHLLYTTSSVKPPRLQRRGGAFLEISTMPEIPDPLVAIRRLPGPLYFGNAVYICETISDVPEECTTLILDMSPCSSIDCPSVHVLHNALVQLRKKKIKVRMAGLRPAPYQTLMAAEIAGTPVLPHSALLVDIEACMTSATLESEESAEEEL